MNLLPDKPEPDANPLEHEIYDLQHECFWDMFALGRLLDGEDDPEMEAKLDKMKVLRGRLEAENHELC